MNRYAERICVVKNRLKNGISKEHKTAFVAVFIIGLLAHMYKFTNSLPIADSLYNYYNHQNIVSSGRWFLMVPCAFSSYFDLPWVIGVFCLVYIALTAVVIVDLFKIKNRAGVVLISGLLVTFPAITETMFFEYTADGYMFAMLLAAAAVWLTVIGRDKWYNYVIGAVLICFCCGIYQAYVSFAMVLALAWLIADMLFEQRDGKTYLKWMAKQLGMYAAGLAAYFVIWKVMLRFWHEAAGTYQGINGVGAINIETIKNAFANSIRSFCNFFVEGGMFSHRLSTYELLNILFAIILITCLVQLICSKKIWKKPLNFAILVVGMCIVPFAAYIWYFTSSEVVYGARMLQSICVVFILLVVLVDRTDKQSFRNAALILSAVIVFNFTIQANISYFYMQRCYENTYATATEMLSRIHMVDDGTAENFAVVGSVKEEHSSLRPIAGTTTPREIANLRETMVSSVIYDYKHVYLFMLNTFDFGYGEVLGGDYTELCDTEETKDMGIWPAADSVKQIDNTIVIKLSEP